MIKHLVLFTLFFYASLISYAQNFQLKGNISDTSSAKASTHQTVVALLRAKDSVLQNFTRSLPDGGFTLKNVRAGAYILLISHPDFADYVDILDIESDMVLPPIYLMSKAVVLQNVIVRGSPIRMRGDTLAFIADSFKVQEGANVEDLLKKLPGITVNAKGEITAQGERVQKVLVDGEEFFGDDPTLATQNMIAKAVKEVQVFDKKSEQADFTGVDDGEKQKTINLKLKDEYKKGYFGKVGLAGGLPNRWENSAMINFFQDKRKLSVYGKMANTNATGLGWGEERQYGGEMGMQTQIMDDGGIGMWSTSDEFGGVSGFNGAGLPTSKMAGISYSDKWNEAKNSIQGAYRFQTMTTEALGTNATQTILPDTQYFNTETSKSFANRWRHKANMRTEIKLDSFQSFVITADGSIGQSETSSNFESEAQTLITSKFKVNNNIRSENALSKNEAFNANILYRLRMKKKGRTLSVNFSEKYAKGSSNGYLLNNLDLYKNGQYSSTEKTDQQKKNNNQSLSLDSRISYTEPIGKRSILEFNYGFNINNSTQSLLSYDKINNEYNDLNEEFSNDFIFNTTTHRGGLAYRYNYKKLTFGAGGDMSMANWKQEDLFKETERNYQFKNFFSRSNLSYKLGQYSTIRLNYNGSTQAPGINQLQPVANNNNPLVILEGNPDLKLAFNHRFTLGYNFYQVLKEQGFWSNFNYSTTNNAFSNFSQVDSSGRRRSKTINVNGNYNFGGYAGYDFKWKKPNLRFSFDLNPQFNRNNSFVNGKANQTKNLSLDFGVSVSKSKEKAYDIYLTMRTGYQTSTSSISPDIITRFWTATPSANLNFFLPFEIILGTDAAYNWRQKTSIFDRNNNALIWNANLSKKIFKKENLRLGVTMRDILNQNIGFNRNVSSNFISERTNNVIQRYWMATLTWNFNKGPQKEEEW